MVHNPIFPLLCIKLFKYYFEMMNFINVNKKKENILLINKVSLYLCFNVNGQQQKLLFLRDYGFLIRNCDDYHHAIKHIVHSLTNTLIKIIRNSNCKCRIHVKINISYRKFVWSLNSNYSECVIKLICPDVLKLSARSW